MDTLYSRDGRAFSQYHMTTDGKPYIVEQRACSRCGGAGGADKWAHTGWTCYECGGHGKGATQTVKLYTAEKLAKLDATRAKAQEKRAAIADAKRAEMEAAASAKRDAFQAANAGLLAWLAPIAESYDFLRDMWRIANERAEWSDAQRAAILKWKANSEARDAAKAASDYVGTIGERITARVTVERVGGYYRQRFGSYSANDQEYVYIVSMRDENGNTLVVKSANFRAEKGETFTLKGTVKEHSTYNSERQTVLQRVALVEQKECA